LASFSSVVRTHVEEALSHNLDKGKLDLKTFDAKHPADPRIDGTEVGPLEALAGNAAQRAELDATNNKGGELSLLISKLFPAKFTTFSVLPIKFLRKKFTTFW
jgi:hypothetical protein